MAEAFINKWVTRFGVPMKLRSDQEWNLESALSQEKNQKLGIRKTDGINSNKRRKAKEVNKIEATINWQLDSEFVVARMF